MANSWTIVRRWKTDLLTISIRGHVALNLLKADTLVKRGVQTRRKLAGWDDSFLAHLLGVKGAGEAGTTDALPAAMNVVLDALWPRGLRTLDMPASAARVWAALTAGPRV